MLLFRHPSDSRLREILDDVKAEPFPYPSVGGTARDECPPGFRPDHLATDLGPDSDDRFARARLALQAWRPQRGTGIRVFPGDPVADGQAFVLVLPLPVAGCAVAPGRVVYVVEESDRYGFAYGTLPGHIERGEEAFVVRREGGRVRFEVTAFSRVHEPLARLGAPVTRLVQVKSLKAYLRAMEAAAE